MQKILLKTVRRLMSASDILALTNLEYRGYKKWLHALPKEPICGLREECKSWIHHWGNGGGDYSTEINVISALDELDSDVPAEISEAICESIGGYCKSMFEASLLTMDIVNDSIREITEME